MRWRLLLEEYRPEKVHIAGVTNIVADTNSKLDMDPTYYIS